MEINGWTFSNFNIKQAILFSTLKHFYLISDPLRRWQEIAVDQYLNFDNRQRLKGIKVSGLITLDYASFLYRKIPLAILF